MKKFKGVHAFLHDEVLMRKFILLPLLLSTLFLTAGFYAAGLVSAQNQNSYSVDLQGLYWRESTLKVLLVTPNNVSWWNSGFLSATLRAIGQWNDAISYFSSNYSDYAYLSRLSLVPTVSNVTEGGFNIYLNWTDFPLSNISNELGLESTTSISRLIINDSINLATHTSHGDALSVGDAQNVALHELGHSLGLGHSNYSSDVMFPDYTLLSPAKSLSTLDVYGVATVFSWLSGYSKPGNELFQVNSVTLPSSISYASLPVSAQNAQPQTLANNVVVQTLIFLFQILIHPEFAAVVVLFIVVLVVVALVPAKKKKPTVPS